MGAICVARGGAPQFPGEIKPKEKKKRVKLITESREQLRRSKEGTRCPNRVTEGHPHLEGMAIANELNPLKQPYRCNSSLSPPLYMMYEESAKRTRRSGPPREQILNREETQTTTNLTPLFAEVLIYVLHVLR